MAGKDYYRILGVSRNATDAELKRAYRTMAIKWHPDKHPAAPDKKKAEEMFKDIAEAYDVLSDKDKRHIYDNFGEEGLKNVPSSNAEGGQRFVYTGVDPTEIFSRFFGSDAPFRTFFEFDDGNAGGAFGMGPGSMRRSAFVNSGPGSMGGGFAPEPRVCPVDLNLSLEDLYSGCKRRLKVSRNRWVNNLSRREDKFLEIDVKPGWKDGTKVKFSGEGDQERPNQPPGDIVFTVRSLPHPTFFRDGNHLIHKVTIPLVKAFSGFKVPIKTLDGRTITESVPPVVSPKTRKIVPHEGMPLSKKPGEKGDLILEFDIVFPTNLTENQRLEIVRFLSDTS